MRIVTRPDFDGIVCAVLLLEAEQITEPVKWVEPNDVQKGLVDIREGDILANLPFHEGCSMWFDHHYTNRIDRPFRGAFKLAPSAAGVVYEYYGASFSRDYGELVRETDKIDSAELSVDEIMHPEKHDYVLLSMTVTRNPVDEPYWNRLVDLLGSVSIDRVMEDPEVRQRCAKVLRDNREYMDFLKKHTRLIDHVSVTDFRPFGRRPFGNRFLVYPLFPESVVHVSIYHENETRKRVFVSAGHSILNRGCRVNVGVLLSSFEGGGHRGAGSCRFPAEKAEEYIPMIIDSLVRNEPNEE